MNLAQGFKDHTYCIDKMRMSEKEKKRFQRMQIQEGSRILIIQNKKGYPFLVELEGCRIAFSKQAALQIEVIPYV